MGDNSNSGPVENGSSTPHKSPDGSPRDKKEPAVAWSATSNTAVANETKGPDAAVSNKRKEPDAAVSNERKQPDATVSNEKRDTEAVPDKTTIEVLPVECKNGKTEP